MGKFDGYLICTDLDGTLLRNNKQISAENLNAIAYFQQEGGIFTFITGRMPFFVDQILAQITPNAPFGCVNGGGLYDHRKQEYLWKGLMPPHVVELIEHVDKTVPGIGIQVYTFQHVYFCQENEAMEIFRNATGLPNLVYIGSGAFSNSTLRTINYNGTKAEWNMHVGSGDIICTDHQIQVFCTDGKILVE